MSSTTTGIYSDETSAVPGIAATEAIAGIVTIILTILGLAHIAPTLLVAIATIAAGVGLALRGAAVAAEIRRIFAERDETMPTRIAGSTWAIEFMAGGAGIVLGILALLQIEPSDLVAIAVIGFGGAMILAGNTAAEMNSAKLSGRNDSAHRLLAGVAAGSAGMRAVAGLQAIVLGILALAGFSPVVLVLIALLVLGSFALLDGSALSSMVLAIFRR